MRSLLHAVFAASALLLLSPLNAAAWNRGEPCYSIFPNGRHIRISQGRRAHPPCTLIRGRRQSLVFDRLIGGLAHQAFIRPEMLEITDSLLDRDKARIFGVE